MGRQGRSLTSQVLVFLASVLFLGWGVWRVPLASGYTDPVQRVRPQDEALYSSIAIGMAERREWLTPRFLGRLSFSKPILTFLPAAAAVKIFGQSLWSLRLWQVLCGSGVLVLLWRLQGASSVLLLASNVLFFTLTRRFLADIPVLLALLLTLSLWKTRPLGASIALGFGLLTKTASGLTPLFFLRGNWLRIAGGAALFAAPWNLYQLAVNGEWYWKEHILDEHLRWGLNTPENAATEGHIEFYASRAWALDPLLTLLAPLALGYCLYRKRWVEAGWLGVSILVLFAFGYRNATYLLPVFAAAALAAGEQVHWSLAALVLGMRLAAGTISHAPPEAVPPAAALAQYQQLRRPNGLLIDGMRDELVATTMHLPRVQYLLPGDMRTLAPTHIDYPGRGIIAPATAYRNRPEPEETVLLVRSPSDLDYLLARATDRDFLLPPGRTAATGDRTVIPSANGWKLVLARND